MTINEFKECLEIAKNHNYTYSKELENNSYNALNGLYVDNTCRICSKQEFAFMLNYQCLLLNGLYDNEELIIFKKYALKLVEVY